jgi:hypothetical protein
LQEKNALAYCVTGEILNSKKSFIKLGPDLIMVVVDLHSQREREGEEGESESGRRERKHG